VSVFAHPSEAEFALLLDRFGLRWEYEPRTFVLERYPDGLPRTAFTPDFYLPDLDLFVELTMLRQALVTRKNRKVRLLRALHPEVRLHVIYKQQWLELRSLLLPGEPLPAAS
jgi:hypothetical protein